MQALRLISLGACCHIMVSFYASCKCTCQLASGDSDESAAARHRAAVAPAS
jgi:hypothetical protein